MSNQAGGHDFPIHHLAATHFASEQLDPDHSPAGVDRQINGGRMDGFADSYAATLAARQVPNPDPGVVMGYYNAADLPVFDHLAEQFCVCDRWHSSVAGATWPNRLYAVTGGADGTREDQKPPLYDRFAFVRHLDAAGVSWRWYSYDVGTLHCADREYLVGHHERFAYVQKLKLTLQAQAEEMPFVDEDAASFLEDAARGQLPAVSWIDPNFKDLDLVGSPPNDDHPPSDVQEGQELVFLIYNALATSPLWGTTLLLVVYTRTAGLLIMSIRPNPPTMTHGSSIDTAFGCRHSWLHPGSPPAKPRTHVDHASIIKTILLRFCRGELVDRSRVGALAHWLDPGHPHYMGKRVANAADVGGLLSRDTSRPPPDRSQLIGWVSERRAARMRRLLTAPAEMLRPAEEHAVTDLQAGILAATQELHARGQPANQP